MMSRHFLARTALACTIGLSSTWVMAAEPQPAQKPEQSQIQDQTRERARDQQREQAKLQDRDRYGWELMTPEERKAHREKMRSFKTEQEREAYRLEHHKEMQARARERGVTLPDMPEAQGRGVGAGPPGGEGGGKGPGGPR